MSKFNYEDSNPKNVFSGEDGILFVHQRENGENCIEINSDNLIDCVKTHIASIFKNDFDEKKLWFRFKTPHGEVSFNVEEFAYIVSKMVMPFFNEDEKKRFNDLMEENYEQIISIEKGEVLWRILEARCNEGIWNELEGFEGNNDMEKFGKYIVSVYQLADGASNPTETMMRIYSDLIPETYKEINTLLNSGELFAALKPLVNILTLGIAHELINNTNIVDVIMGFISRNADKMGIVSSMFNRPKTTYKGFEVAPGFDGFGMRPKNNENSWVNPVEGYYNNMRQEADAPIPPETKNSLSPESAERQQAMNDLYTALASKFVVYGNSAEGVEYLEKLSSLMEKAQTMPMEELRKGLEELKQIEENLQKGNQNQIRQRQSPIDFKEIKSKFIKEIDSILDKASTMDKEEFIKTVKSYKENFAQLFDVYQAKKELDDELNKIRL